MPGISGIGRSYLSDDAESKIQSWQILLTSSMMRLCWPVTHFFLEKKCEEKHDLDKCEQFNMSVDERSKMLRRKRLCYGYYLLVSAEHTTKICKKKRVCKICTMKHPTGLHGYVPRWKGGGGTDERW